MHYSAKRWSDLAFKREIEQVAGSRAKSYASQDSDRGRIDLHTLLGTPAAGVHLYVCGPRRLIDSVRDVAADKGWPTEQIHFESFGAAPTPEDRPITLTLAKSVKTLSIPATQSILDTLLDAGHAVPHDCKRGECSLCTTRVLGGEPDHRDLCLSSADRDASMCVCVSRAKGDYLVLDL